MIHDSRTRRALRLASYLGIYRPYYNAKRAYGATVGIVGAGLMIVSLPIVVGYLRHGVEGFMDGAVIALTLLFIVIPGVLVGIDETRPDFALAWKELKQWRLRRALGKPVINDAQCEFVLALAHRVENSDIYLSIEQLDAAIRIFTQLGEPHDAAQGTYIQALDELLAA